MLVYFRGLSQQGMSVGLLKIRNCCIGLLMTGVERSGQEEPCKKIYLHLVEWSSPETEEQGTVFES